MTDSLFTGLRVIDCASWIAGPAAATILSDFGADVIKIEPPGVGDPWRGRIPYPGRSIDYYWELTSRNKRSLAIDLKHPDGIAALHRLVARGGSVHWPCGCAARARQRCSRTASRRSVPTASKQQ